MMKHVWFALLFGPSFHSSLTSANPTIDSSNTTNTLSDETTITQAKNIDLLYKLHGIFMMLGWMLCAGPSLFTPRYLRQRWTSTRFCGLQLWFVIHRTLMACGIVFVIIGLALIFDANDWTFYGFRDYWPEWFVLHPWFGLFSSIVIFSNPLGALLRPKPDHKWRPLFNWAHGLFGGAGFLMAVYNLITGAIHEHEWDKTTAMYPIMAWAACHFTIEALFIFRCLLIDKNFPSQDEQTAYFLDPVFLFRLYSFTAVVTTGLSVGFMWLTQL